MKDTDGCYRCLCVPFARRKSQLQTHFRRAKGDNENQNTDSNHFKTRTNNIAKRNSRGLMFEPSNIVHALGFTPTIEIILDD